MAESRLAEIDDRDATEMRIEEAVWAARAYALAGVLWLG